jgi:hypothetical protein
MNGTWDWRLDWTILGYGRMVHIFSHSNEPSVSINVWFLFGHQNEAPSGFYLRHCITELAVNFKISIVFHILSITPCLNSKIFWRFCYKEPWYRDKFFFVFLSSFTKIFVLSQIRPQPLSSMYFPFSYSLIALSFDTVFWDNNVIKLTANKTCYFHIHREILRKTRKTSVWTVYFRVRSNDLPIVSDRYC